ncbi:MAG: formyltetrahydrofolate deformylase [Chitinophagaceae bacterium]|nr:formyltetrahydrofolate deformylase [Chitinophagaceae bacterium]
MAKVLTILVDSPDEKGLIYKITGILYNRSLNIVKNREFVDSDSNRFFMRTEVEGVVDECLLEEELTSVLPDQSKIKVVSDRRKKLVILVTKENHCLGDLLVRNHFKEWNADILAVIGNYDVLKSFTEKFNVPFHFVDATNMSRDMHEQAMLKIIDGYAPDYLVLAKYMRVLTPEFVKNYEERIINIHHSFLPAFIGGHPYRQAYLRGVKIIGATAHFVNNSLDEGPIICQNVIPVDHSQNASDMARAGKDIEKIVLAQSLKMVLEDRVMLSGNKTVIL